MEGRTVLVTNIERFATHDGPGIRTTVFLKGCPLHCPWCANPETQSPLPVLMHDARSCSWCGECARACARGAIRVLGNDFAWDAERCRRCGDCARACLREAVWLEGRAMSVDDVIAVAARDRAYYERSGGGVTFSGGEPLARRDQILELVRAARAAGLSVAVETTGNVSGETVRELEPLVDVFLHDLKHADDALLEKVTGGSGRLIRDNLAWLLARCPERVEVRIPVIPGFNHDEATIRSMLDWARGRGCRRVALLPYHTLGRGKYERLGRVYASPERSLADEDLAAYHEYALSLGMESKIGG